jgi:hypothetical protein
MTRVQIVDLSPQLDVQWRRDRECAAGTGNYSKQK